MFVILCCILQLKAHELVTPKGRDYRWGKRTAEIGILQLYELFSGSKGITDTLPDSAFWATDNTDSNHAAKFAAFNKAGHWSGVKTKPNQITVDLMTSYIVTGVATKQSNPHNNEWTTRYSVETSENGRDWISLGTFKGNFDKKNICKSRFKTPVLARFVKLIVIEYHVHPSLKFDVLVYEMAHEMAYKY